MCEKSIYIYHIHKDLIFFKLNSFPNDVFKNMISFSKLLNTFKEELLF